MNRPLLERRSPLRVSYALLLLTAFFFFIPSAFRAARLSLGKKENNVKDWLPSDFPETAELEWFADHFAGEAFVLATWPGCDSGDQRLKLLEQKLLHESDTYDPTIGLDPETAREYRRAREVGRELNLLRADTRLDNWAGLQEKWFATPQGRWHYITPDGRLYRWEESVNIPAAAIRATKRSLGMFNIRSQLVTGFGDKDGTGPNPFYNDPSLLSVPLFHSVQTGDSIAAELSAEGGPLWPRDLTDASQRKTVAMRRAIDRLTGTLYAPAVPPEFDWSADSFRNSVPEQRRAQLPKDFGATVNETVEEIVKEDYGGSLQQLQQAPTVKQAEAWYAVFDAAEVEPPPRRTCVLVTLTDIAQDNLPFALGRGLLGAPRGRLLQLAEESGVQPAAPPSLAPPPFNKPEVESIAGVPPLRLGGPPVDNISIDEEGTVTLARLVGYSVVVGIILSFLCFRSFLITMMVFIVGGSAAVLSMSFVWWMGGRVDAILMSMPSLVYVLGLSGAIHVINYYRDEVRLRGEKGAASRALRHAVFPCTLASVTTAIGLISLATSNLTPIKNFGLYSAIGVIATLAILFTYLPASLEVFAPGLSKADKARQKKSKDSEPQESWLSEAWASAGRWITRHHAVVSVTCLLMLVGGAIGLAKIRTSVQLLKLFSTESRIIRDYGWLESNFGKLVPTELILRVPPSMQAEKLAQADSGQDSDGIDPLAKAQSLRMLERVEAVSRIGTVVRRALGETGLQLVGQTMSADTFLEPLPEPDNSWSMQRGVYDKSLLEGREELLGSDYVRIEQAGPYQGSELWRVSLRVSALSDVDYGYFISTLREAVEPVMRAYDTREQLIAELVTDEDSGKIAPKLSGKDRVLVIGAEKPGSLANVQPVNLEGIDDVAAETSYVHRSRLDKHAIYLATLRDVLSGEPIQKGGIWLDPNSPNNKLEIGGDKWNSIIGRFDAVVWVSDEGVSEEDLTSAKKLIDARHSATQRAKPILVGDSIPSVEGAGNLQVIYTGVVPVVYKAQRTLLSSLIRSIALAFLLIAAVMIVLLNPGQYPFSWLRSDNFRSGFSAGMVSMIPNAFPVLFVFGMMGHSGRLVDIGTMMTASVAMGVAVDDTIHFLTWFRSFLDKGMTRVEAVIETYRRVGPAMTQTTIVGGLGLFVFALSTFTPTQRFGTLMLVLLAAALFGDLVLLPALLAGPAGKFFKPREGPRHEPLDSGDGQAEVDEPQESKTEPAEPSEPISAPAGDETTEVVIDKESLPQLRVHFPQDADGPHRLKRR